MSNERPRLFVAGCNGQLGHDAMDVLASDYTLKGMDLPELDITDTSSLSRHLDAFSPCVILNGAAFTNVDACESDRTVAQRVNATGPRLLAEYAAERGVRLVHISTDYVFDGLRPPPAPYVEADAPAPRTQYGQTKLDGEEAVRGSRADAAILRTAWLYGMNGRNFLKTILRVALQNPERPLKVVDDQHGTPTWSYRLALQIQALLRNWRPGLYHATGEAHCTWYDFAKRFLERIDVPHRIVPCTTDEYPLPAPRPPNSILENQALKEHGVNVMVSWQEDLDTFTDRYREQLLREARDALNP